MPELPEPSDSEVLADFFGEGDVAFENRRAFERLDITTRAELIPLTDRGPRYESSLSAETRNVSRGGIALDSLRAASGAAGGPSGSTLANGQPSWKSSSGRSSRTMTANSTLSCKFIRRLDRQ